MLYCAIFFLAAAASAERPCAPSIKKHCAAAKGVTATRQCLQSQLNRGTLEHACEVLVGTRAATVGACKAPAAALCPAKVKERGKLPAGAHPSGYVRFPLACLRKHLRRGKSSLRGTDCANRLVALKELRERARLVKHREGQDPGAAADRRARIQAILDAMPPAEKGGLADEHARLVAAAHQADKEAREAAARGAFGSPAPRFGAHGGAFGHLPDGTHVKATKVGPPSSRFRPPGELRTKRRVPPPAEGHAARPPPGEGDERLRKKRRKDALHLVGA